MKILTFSTLFPSSVRPSHGIFVETRLRELLKSGQVESRVIAPVPWFPSTNPRWGDYARFAATPLREQRNGLDVRHPRYLLAPKVGMTLAPLTLALGARAVVRELIDEGFDFDLIDAHYYYPDGVAAALLAKWFGKPLTITARGTDLNLISQYALPRRMIEWAARRAAGSIGVCAALMDVLRGWGHDPARLNVLRNGVDLERFKPLPQDRMRAELGVGGEPLLLSVGHLIERKGHHVAIEALAEMVKTRPGARLLVIGEGQERAALTALAARLGVNDKLRLTGSLPNTELLKWYSAADVLLLCSSREGWANVLLESMACGTPVVATDIWGTPEVVAAPEAGRLVAERTGAAFAAGIEALLADGTDRAATRRYAEGFSWQSTTDGQLRLFNAIKGEGGRA
ncbi:glycosyltransferase family 4 protein [Pelomonas aquatica]|uniref:Glycosyltransferase family 4 protein n=1 Tax=Pelomonas aquatica TaxID=431058 RepID=A0A9X4LMT9_9BURK|nr:glycosyltransferase family 4 protein [Pelomonas aquatica]MCY4756635.1 glycosyltransferase family 4 protein [Pelomonas aquatica]MDG0863830.1 glycosyltransferase family 4 protein [Pelomonas aquatica]